MPTATVTLDTRKFEAAVKFVFNNTRRALPEIINRAALVTIIGGKGVEGAMQRTRKAAAGSIRAVPPKAIAAYIAKKYPQQRTKQQMTEAVKKEYKRRVAAIGYTAIVGWNRAAIDLGGTGTRKGSRAGKGYASMGYAIPASYGNYEAIIANTTPAAELIGAQPLQEALDATAADMIAYWQKQTGATFP